jgi:glyoxylase-like metal-dependent hydrolase (beta-lactamase superfamily II)
VEIIKGIHRVDDACNNMAHSNVYLVIEGKELLVVDTGTPGNAKKIVDYIQKLGYQPSDVSTIILTHCHMDHMGSAKELQTLTNAKIEVGLADAEVVAGSKPYPKPKNVLFRAVTSLMKPSPVAVDISLKDGDAIGSLRIVEVPGHTMGSIALLDSKRGALFTGDTLRVEDQKVGLAPKPFTVDEAAERKSVEKIAALDFEVLLPGHGDVLIGNASKAVKTLLSSIMH